MKKSTDGSRPPVSITMNASQRPAGDRGMAVDMAGTALSRPAASDGVLSIRRSRRVTRWRPRFGRMTIRSGWTTTRRWRWIRRRRPRPSRRRSAARRGCCIPTSWGPATPRRSCGSGGLRRAGRCRSPRRLRPRCSRRGHTADAAADGRADVRGPRLTDLPIGLWAGLGGVFCLAAIMAVVQFSRPPPQTAGTDDPGRRAFGVRRQTAASASSRGISERDDDPLRAAGRQRCHAVAA